MKRTPLKRKKAWGRLGCGAMAFLAKPVTEGDKHFDSTTERDRYRFLEMLEKGGAISDLRFREKVILVPATDKAGEIAWNIDFSYTEDGRRVWEDSKNRPLTDREALLIHLWEHFGPGLLRLTGAAPRFPVLRTVMGLGCVVMRTATIMFPDTFEVKASSNDQVTPT